MFELSQVKNLQLEISSYCNAACPQCPRNKHGGSTIEDLPLTNWSMDQFNHVIGQVKNFDIDLIYFCGTYGDPMMNPHILEMCDVIKKTFKNCKIGIHTNGGLQYHGLYRKLATAVDFCAFGIDGLEETNHLYRRKVSWNKLMENAGAFIESGGHAIWDFIVFEHNQHQVESARQMANDLGFKEFNIKKTSRFISRKHEVTNEMDVYNDQNQKEYVIKIPTDKTYINSSYEEIYQLNPKQFKNYLKTTSISCNACRIKEIYIGSDGLVFPCGWLHDRLYCADAKTHDDYKILHDLFDEIGGINHANIFFTPIQQIVDHTWFPIIEKQWPTNSIERCALMCGSKYNIIGNQNQEISYKQ